MNLIIPMAGRSSRFPNVKPKWMLAHPSGNFMAIQAISKLNLSKFDRIVFVALQKHETDFSFKKGFEFELDSLGIQATIHLLDSETKDVTETVSRTIIDLNLTGTIFIKDVDSCFTLEDIPEYNSIVFSHLKNTSCKHPESSSYVTFNEGMITNIVEKQIISPFICVGGYIFNDATNFVEISNYLNSESERYISHVIYFDRIYNNSVYKGVEITDLEDWGTLEDWKAYKHQFATLFVDIDGVLMQHLSIHFPPYLYDSASPIEDNIQYLQSLDTEKVQIILTTSRPEWSRQETIDQLRYLGVKYDQLVMGLKHNQRILINDFSDTNEFPNCSAVNIKRNSNDLSTFLRPLIR
jgi:hypothetical protein